MNSRFLVTLRKGALWVVTKNCLWMTEPMIVSKINTPLKACTLKRGIMVTLKKWNLTMCGICGCCPWCWSAVAMGLSTQKGNMLFLPLCVLRPDCGSKQSIREGVKRDFLLTLSQVWAGQRASQHAWPEGPFWSQTLSYAVTRTQL